MESRNNKNAYSKITRREMLLTTIFLSAICLGVIVFSIRDFVDGQYFRSLTRITIALLFLFFVGFFFKKRQKTVSDQIKSLQENSMQTRFSVSSDVEMNRQTDDEKIPIEAKVMLWFCLLLVVGVCVFAFTILCKSISASPTQILILALIAGSIVVLLYFGVQTDPIFNKITEKGEVLIRRLTVTEQVIAIIATISLCAGVVLWFFH